LKKNNEVTHTYRAYGIDIESDIIFPELNISENKPEVKIASTNLSDFKNNTVKGVYSFVEKDVVHIQVRNYAIFRIKDGISIEYQILEEGNEDFVRLYILGMCFSALLHQRNLLPIHASCLMGSEKAFLICGQSQAGKSTTSSAFIRHGYRSLADDIAVIDALTTTTPKVWPGFPHMKMWPDTANSFFEGQEFRQLIPSCEKLGLKTNSFFHDKAETVGNIYIIEKKEIKSVHIQELKGINKANALFEQVFRLKFALAMNKQSSIFQHITKLGKHSKVYLVSRPIIGDTVESVYQSIRATLNS
jgi:hypothetical protein